MAGKCHQIGYFASAALGSSQRFTSRHSSKRFNNNDLGKSYTVWVRQCLRLVSALPYVRLVRSVRGRGGVEIMQRQPLVHEQRERIAAGLPFVESLARRVASSMPHSIELGDLVQDGMLGLIDAACRFDEARGIKFETFAERRVRGAMIDALRRDAWPRGVRRQRRELEAAREQLRRELGAEPSLADLAARVGSDEARLGRTIVRINTIESTSPLSAGENIDGSSLPPALVPSEPVSPDKAFEEREVRDRIRAAIASLPPRERKVIGMYYYAESTMKQIGNAIGVNESRVSQLHARAVQRLRKALGADCSAADAAAALKPAILSFQQTMQRMKMAKAAAAVTAKPMMEGQSGVVLEYRVPVKIAKTTKATMKRPLPAARIAAAR